MRTLMMSLLLLLLGCRGADLRPQAIESHDTCARCRMAISEPRYAAQIVDKDGTAYKFDDIGCMMSFAREHQLMSSGGANIYVMDYAGSRWLDAEHAVFVKSGSFDTPMASGLAAFRDQAAARNFTRDSAGQMLSYQDAVKTLAKLPHSGQ